ncbi:LysR substrate-binding domain-containing protein [Bordetella bronchiseptica]
MAAEDFALPADHNPLDTDLLNVFCWVAKTQSFSRAAAELGTSQPVITRKIGRLEECLGVALFVRSNRGCVLTAAGTVLIGKAPSILLQLAEIKEEVSHSASVVSGSLSMGITHAASTVMAPRLLPVIARRWPKLQVDVMEALSRTLVERVLHGELALAVLFDPPPHPDLICRPLLIERLCLVGNPQSDLRTMAPPTIRDLARLPLMLPSGGQIIRNLLEDAFAEINEPLKPVYEAASMAMLREMAVQGIGYTLLTQGGVSEDVAAGKLIAQALPDKGMVVTLTLITKRESTRLRNVRLLSDFVASEIRAVARQGQWPGHPTVVGG